MMEMRIVKWTKSRRRAQRMSISHVHFGVACARLTPDSDILQTLITANAPECFGR